MTAPSRTLSRIPADLRPLLPLPPLHGLTAAKARGAECTWCAKRLSIATSVDLGERPAQGGITLFLRGCHRCTLRAAGQAYIAHPGPCPQCVYDLKPCPVMQALLTLLLELPR
ncbi:hypothetical protein ABZ760_21205 [Streptomyces sp. NPDC006658]|uniref:hypothetical protein n=1 Tax=Streptomyces sp. NPDC006658 TaxID=3156900 RepID=UPI0033F73633